MIDHSKQNQLHGLEIAVIGMAGRFPGAKNTRKFWKNLKNGIESIGFFTEKELINTGISQEVLENPNYVNANGMLEDYDYFDASFFDYLPMDVEIMDPQVRIFHECVWEALEDAGYDPYSYNGLIGLYAGASVNTPWVWDTFKLWTGEPGKAFGATLFFDKDFLTTRISYKLNLRGPSSTIFTACSTSLVAIHQACQGLLSGECGIALAGGASVLAPQVRGYWYQEGLIYSPDGHCRPFDAAANGTIFGSGVGVVVLKQLEPAVKHRDNIHAIIKGSAVNNDGNQKVGFTAPGVKGQAAVIRAALHAAEAHPHSIGYIETHGTGTDMGDPIEVEALIQAFQTNKKGSCALGSVKGNIGHLDIAAGAASFQKTVLMLKHQIIPPTLHFSTPNPEIDFDSTPFYVNAEQREWKRGKYPRRAGVSSFGIGGTNAHVVLEEWPEDNRQVDRCRDAIYRVRDKEVSPPYQSRDYQLIILSAKTQSALDKMTENLAEYLKKNLLNRGNHENPTNPGLTLADVAYTLQVGRSPFDYRAFFICTRVNEAIEALSSPGSTNTYMHRLSKKNKNKRVVFMFPGQGSQYVNMGLDLYRTELIFREEMDLCFEILTPIMGYNIKEILYPDHSVSKVEPHAPCPMPHAINQTEIAQPVIFIIEYALAKLLIKWGIEPAAMIGHSIGEYTAACLSGVFSLADALKLVAWRGKLMQQMPPGAMFTVPLSEEVLTPLLDKDISLAAVNSPSLCVVSGNQSAMDAFAKKLEKNGHEIQRLHTSHAFHSSMMDPVLSGFKEKVTQVRINEPKIPYISNVTGKWLTGEEVADPGYWAIHLRKTVRFAHGLTQLLKEANTIFIEVGPGQVLSTLTRKQAKHINEKDTGKKADLVMINLIRHPQEQVPDHRYLLTKIGQLWLYGQSIDWSAYYAAERRSRISLPTYPFERQRYAAALKRKTLVSAAPQKKALEDWFYIPSWKRSLQPLPDNNDEDSEQGLPGWCWLVFTDTLGLGAELVNRLEKNGHQVIFVRMGPVFSKVDDNNYTLNPHTRKDYEDLSQELVTLKKLPNGVLHLWNVTGANGSQLLLNEITTTLSSGFFSLLHMAGVIGKLDLPSKIRVIVITDHMQEVVGGELLFPHKAALLGPVQVINHEYPNLHCRSIDIVLPPRGTREYKRLVEQLLAEIAADSPEPVIAYRNTHRWCRTFEPVPFKESKSKKTIPRLKKKGVYLVTGGLGGIGLVLAEHLARSVRARLILTGRSPLPLPSQWHQWVEEHENYDPVSLKIKKVLELEKIGSEVMVFSSDVTDPEQMQAVFNQARERFGAINGVIHAAGVPDGPLIQRRTQEMSEEVLAPKIKGTLVLDQLLRDQELDFFMCCSSILSVLAPMGQAAYSAANAFLDAFAFHRTYSHNGFTVAVNWDVWQKVGMAVNPPAIPQLQLKKLTHPLFHRYMANGMNLAIFTIKLSVNKHWFLDEHRIMGSAIVPGTVYLELARAAFEVHVGKETVEIREVYYLNPLLVADDEEKELHVLLIKQEGYFEFFYLSSGPVGTDEWISHAHGEIAAVNREGTQAAPPKTHNIKDIENQCHLEKIILAQQEQKPYDQSFIDVGPRWDHSLKEVKLGKHQGLAWFQLPKQYTGDMKSFKLHPALLDYATSYLIMTNKHINVISGGYLPFSYQRLSMNGPMPTSMFCYSRWVENKSGERRTVSFDVTIMDEEGNEKVDIKGFTLLTVRDEGKPIVQRVRDRFPAPPDIFHLNKGAPGAARASAGYREEALKTGILPAEGIEVFNRVMGSNGTTPQILVCTQDLENLRQQINIAGTRVIFKEPPHKKFTGTTQIRPQLSSIYVPPRNKTEEILGQTLESYLGIDKIGMKDNFFELGVSSLDLIQMSQKFTAAIGTEIPVVNLFRFPMIGLLAEYLDRQGSKDNSKEKAKKRVDAVIDGRLGMKSRRQLIAQRGGK